MAAKSPAKPWESQNNSVSVITPPAPVTKHNNNPHINRSGSSLNAPNTADIPGNTSTNTNNNTTPQTTTAPQPQPQQLMQPSYGGGYGGYGGGMGGGMYGGNSMYGGGMYGNSMYGGGMGMGYGMNGMNGMYGPMQGPMGPMGFMQMSVNNVGRFSQLLQLASQALHMTFSSLVQFAGGIGMLAREFGGFLSGVYIFRFLKWLYLKIRKFLFWIIGKKPSTKEQFEEMFKSAVDATAEAKQNDNTPSSSSTHYSWLSIGFYCFGILYVIQWIWKSISRELDQQKKVQMQQQQQQQLQQQQMMNPMNPYQQNLAFAQNNPYGYYQPNNPYGNNNNMYYQQPQQTQQATVNNNNAGKQNEANDSNNNKSESLLAKPQEATVTV